MQTGTFTLTCTPVGLTIAARLRGKCARRGARPVPRGTAYSLPKRFMRERIAYFFRQIADCFDSYGKFPVYVSDEGIYLRYFDELSDCFHYDGELLQGGLKVYSEERERFRVIVQTGDCDTCYQGTHWLALEFRGRDGIWKPILLMHEAKLAVLQ